MNHTGRVRGQEGRVRKRWTGWVCALALLLGWMGCARAGGFLTDPDAIERAAQSVFYLEVFDSRGRLLSTGSGFLAFDGRTVVTNQHVIAGGTTITATDEQNRTFPVAGVLAEDARRDLAILSLQRDTGLPPLELADKAGLRRGQPVLAIGSPQGLRNTVSNGIISLTYARGELPDIQFTAPISDGSSGGALFNDAGQVIGVTSQSYTDGQNLNLAVSSAHVLALHAQALRGAVQDAPPVRDEDVWFFVPRAEIFDDAVYLDWPDVPGAMKYRVYRWQAPGSAGETPCATTKTSGFNDRQAVPGQTYLYRVDALDGQGALLGRSAEVTCTAYKPGAAPQPPSENPVAFGEDGYVGTVDAPSLNPQLTHTGAAGAVRSVTLAFYCADGRGRPVPAGGQAGPYVFHQYYLTLRPGQTAYPGRVSLSVPAPGAQRVYCAIIRTALEDGTTYDVPEADWDFYYWEMD